MAAADMVSDNERIVIFRGLKSNGFRLMYEKTKSIIDPVSIGSIVLLPCTIPTLMAIADGIQKIRVTLTSLDIQRHSNEVVA